MARPDLAPLPASQFSGASSITDGTLVTYLNQLEAIVNDTAIRTSFIWSQPDVITSQSIVPIGVGGGSDVNATEIVMPWNGSVVAMSGKLESPRTAGTATFDGTIFGAQVLELNIQFNATDPQFVFATFNPST